MHILQRSPPAVTESSAVRVERLTGQCRRRFVVFIRKIDFEVVRHHYHKHIVNGFRLVYESDMVCIIL